LPSGQARLEPGSEAGTHASTLKAPEATIASLKEEADPRVIRPVFDSFKKKMR
jgi:hypothetical protein